MSQARDSSIDSHKHLKELMSLLGYTEMFDAKLKGICNGISNTACNAALCGEFDKYVKRLNLLKQLTSTSLRIQTEYAKFYFRTKNRTNQYLQNKDEKNKYDEHKETIEILAFFDAVMLYQSPLKYNDVFDRGLFQRNEEIIFYHAAPERLAKQGGTLSILFYNGILKNEEFDQLISAIQRVTHSSNFNEDFVLLIHSELNSDYHAIAIYFKNITHNWYIIDVNDLEFINKALSSETRLQDKIKMSFNSIAIEKFLIKYKFILRNRVKLLELASIKLEVKTAMDKFKKFLVMVDDRKLSPTNEECEAINPSLDVMIQCMYQHNKNDSEKLLAKLKNSFQSYTIKIVFVKEKQFKLHTFIENLKNDYEIRNFFTPIIEKILRKNLHGLGHIHLAVINNQVKDVKAMLAYDVNLINLPDDDGTTPLFYAIQNGSIDVLRLLLTYEQLDTRMSKDKLSALMYTIYVNDVIACKLLLDSNKFYWNINSALFIAIIRKKLAVIKLLCDFDNFDINNEENTGSITPLLYTIYEQEYDVFFYLITHNKINLNYETKIGNTPLCAAITSENNQALIALLRHKNINIYFETKADNYTPAIFAAIYKPQALNILMSYGIDLSLPNSLGQTPLRMAMQHENEESIKLLTAYMQFKNSCNTVNKILEENSDLEYAYFKVGLTSKYATLQTNNNLLITDRVEQLKIIESFYVNLKTIISSISSKNSVRNQAIRTLLCKLINNERCIHYKKFLERFIIFDKFCNQILELRFVNTKLNANELSFLTKIEKKIKFYYEKLISQLQIENNPLSCLEKIKHYIDRMKVESDLSENTFRSGRFCFFSHKRKNRIFELIDKIEEELSSPLQSVKCLDKTSLNLK